MPQLLATLGRHLRANYADIVEEGLPEHLASLVVQLDRQSRRPVSRRRALVVEDDPSVCATASIFLEELGFDVKSCDTAEAALDEMTDHGPHIALIFADIRLAGRMDGVDLAHVVADRWPTARVVVTSGAPGDRAKDLPANVVFFPKPWRGLDVLLQADRTDLGGAMPDPRRQGS